MTRSGHFHAARGKSIPLRLRFMAEPSMAQTRCARKALWHDRDTPAKIEPSSMDKML